MQKLHEDGRGLLEREDFLGIQAATQRQNGKTKGWAIKENSSLTRSTVDLSFRAENHIRIHGNHPFFSLSLLFCYLNV